MMSSGLAWVGKGSTQALCAVADDALGNEPRLVMTAHGYVRDAGASGHVEHQQLRRQMVDQGREPLVDLVTQINRKERLRKRQLAGSMNHDRTATRGADPAYHLLCAIQTIAWRGQHDHDTAGAPSECQEILQVCPFLQIAGDAVDRH